MADDETNAEIAVIAGREISMTTDPDCVPMPLVPAVPDPAPFPLDALGPLKAYAEAIHQITEAPIEICAQSVLGTAALATQGLADVELPHGGACPTSLFILTIAQSGERKTSCDKLATRGVRAFEQSLMRQYEEDMKQYRRECALLEARRKGILDGIKNAEKAQDTKKSEALQASLDEIADEPEPPLAPSIIASDPTLEGLIKNLGMARPSLGVFSSEGGTFIGGSGMNADNRLRTIAGFSKFWDGEPIDRWRAGDSISMFYGRRVSIHIQVQPIAAVGLLADPLAQEQGFLARFLTSEPKSRIGHRTGNNQFGVQSTNAKVNDFAAQVLERLKWPLPLKSGTVNELAPPILRLEEEAREALLVFGCETEMLQRDNQKFAPIRPFASKAVEQAVRVSGVMTQFENPVAASIDKETAERAITLVRYYLSEALRMAEKTPVHELFSQAEVVRNWIDSNWEEQFISRADIQQFGPGPVRDSKLLKQIFKVLIEYEVLSPCSEPKEIKGKKRREAYEILKQHA